MGVVFRLLVGLTHHAEPVKHDVCNCKESEDKEAETVAGVAVSGNDSGEDDREDEAAEGTETADPAGGTADRLGHIDRDELHARSAECRQRS